MLKEKPTKRPRAPPDSDTKDGKGYINIWVLFSTFLLAIKIPNVVSLSIVYVSTEDVGRLYSVYLQGTLQPVSVTISSMSKRPRFTEIF